MVGHRHAIAGFDHHFAHLHDAGFARFGCVVVATEELMDLAARDGCVDTPDAMVMWRGFLARQADGQVQRVAVVISSMVNIGGKTVIGRNTYIGMGALVKDQVRIGDGVIVGMGSVVFNDLPDNVIALGNPARPMRPNLEQRVFK